MAAPPVRKQFLAAASPDADVSSHDMSGFEWDETDMHLSEEKGFEWLKNMKVIPSMYTYQTLSTAQQRLVSRLLKKMEKHSANIDATQHTRDDLPSLIPDLQDSMEIGRLLEEVSLLFPVKAQGSMTKVNSKENVSANGSKTALALVQESLEKCMDRAIPEGEDVTQMNDLTQRLANAWTHEKDRVLQNRRLELEMSSIILMSRARLQAELTSLRSENEALRRDQEGDVAFFQALAAEKALTSALQETLNNREARLTEMAIELQRKNDEIARLRSERDKSMWQAVKPLGVQRRLSAAAVDQALQYRVNSIQARRVQTEVPETQPAPVSLGIAMPRLQPRRFEDIQRAADDTAKMTV
eukprot:m.148836 g.148836  ORF g.148836 m.148836 type:complete len:356 (-) comp16841_c0_seq1:1722-2789(-)